jgi:hypothetical protein
MLRCNEDCPSSTIGNTNGIFWVVQTNGSDPGNVNASDPLFAYDASNLSDELYDTNESVIRWIAPSSLTFH